MFSKIGIVVITLLLLFSGCISSALPRERSHESKIENSNLLNTSDTTTGSLPIAVSSEQITTSNSTGPINVVAKNNNPQKNLLFNTSTNNRLSLSIPDPYGSNQFNHPDVYYNASGVFGHKWWMLITPFPYSNSTYENACLYYSDDGLLWHVPSGVTNPIGKPIVSDYDSKAHGSSPDIVYDPITRKLMCYYVIGDVVGNLTIEDPKVRTYDGSTVSSEMNVTAHGISPSVLYDNSTGTYYMWIVDIDLEPHVIYRYTSTDGVHFSNKQAIGQSSDYQPWMMNTMNYPGNSTIYALFRFVGNDNLYLATANNYTDNFTVQGLPLLQISDPSCAIYKDIQLDRSAGVFSDDGNFLNLWIPAKDTNGIWTSFYTQATKENGLWTVDKGVNKYPSHGVIYWKGQNWYMSKGKADPINNYWNTTGAWIDGENRLHLTIVKDEDRWKCTMLNSQHKYLYGTFTWKVASPIYTFDINSVVGFFTYFDDNNELDIETSRWGNKTGDQLSYSVQPKKIKGNVHSYMVPSNINGINTTYTIEWKPEYVRFTSLQENGKFISDYKYTNISGIPQHPSNILMNLWLWDWNQPPTNGENIELIISDFTINNSSNEID